MRERKLSKSDIYKAITIILLLLLSITVTVLENPYKDNDAYWVSVITNGVFGADNFCVHTSPILCVVLKYLKVIFPTADVFVLLMHISYYVTVVLFGYIIIGKSKNNNILSITILLFLIFSIRIGMQTYTIQATYFTMFGWFTYIVFDKQNKTMWLKLIALYLILLGTIIRIEGALLVIPFALLYSGYCFCAKEYKVEIRNICKVATPMLIVIMVFVSNNLYDQMPGNQIGREYNSNRISIVDFPMKSWEEIENKPTWLSQNDYESAIDHLLIDVENVDADYLKQIHEIGYIEKEIFNRQAITDGLKSLVQQLAFTDTRTTCLFFLTCLMFVIILFMSDTIVIKSTAVLAFAGMLLVMLYFGIKGRLIIRVCQCTLMPALVVLLLLFCYINRKKNLLNLVIAGCLISISLLNVVLFISKNELKPHFAIDASVVVSEPEFPSSTNQDAIYIWETHAYNNIALSKFKSQGKLPSEEFIIRNITEGDWPYGQKYMTEYFDRAGIPDTLGELLTDREVYYIAENKAQIECYIHEHIDSTISFEKVGVFEGLNVWKVGK